MKQKPLIRRFRVVVLLLSFVFALCQNSWAKNNKEFSDAEKCIDAASKIELKKKKPKASSVIQKCDAEIKALTIFMEQNGNNDFIDSEEAESFRRKLDSIN